jgi:hypothetical protein
MRAITGSPAFFGVLIAGMVLSGCGSDDVSAPAAGAPRLDRAAINSMADTVRLLAAGRGVTQLPTPAPVRPALVALGRRLPSTKSSPAIATFPA